MDLQESDGRYGLDRFVSGYGQNAGDDKGGNKHLGSIK